MKSSAPPLHLQHRMGLLLRLIAAFIGFLVIWLLFVFQATENELMVGAVASVLAVASGYVAARAVPPCFAPRLFWVAQAWRLPGAIATDLWLLLKHLAREIVHRRSRSAFEIASFKATGEDCQAAAQRALAVLFVSTAPNSVVLDIDRQKGEMLFHQMEPAPAPELIRKLQE